MSDKHSPLPWKWVKANTLIYIDEGDRKNRNKYGCADDAIIDANGVEVLGTSEWIRISDEDKEFIIKACNSFYSRENND